MEIMVIGLGSMGKRRIRLLRELFPEFPVYGIDAKKERRMECEAKFSVATHENIEACLRDHSVEAVFVCTPPLSHAGIIRDCLLYGLHIFSEINLVNTGYEENMAVAKQKNRVLFLSSTPMYREEINYITHEVEETKGVVNYLFHVGQYLPDWHPWDALQDFFISKKETNGCREIFAIELPWLVHAFGRVKRISSMHHKASSLPVSYDDSYFVCLEHESGHYGTLIVDVVSREAVKRLEVFGENLFLTWDGTPDSLRKKNLETSEMEQVHVYREAEVQQERAYQKNILENAYAAEIQNFIGVIRGEETPKYSFAEDREILQWINQIEL